jgi:hypothetical protein
LTTDYGLWANGIGLRLRLKLFNYWIPAFAGMTVVAGMIINTVDISKAFYDPSASPTELGATVKR